MDSGWIAPGTRVDADSARRAILWQHRRIRTLLERAAAVAEAALAGTLASPDAVSSAVGDVRATLEIHLTFEEKVILPILRDDLPIGPQRAENLVDEHKRQRAMLAQIHAEAIAHPELPELAAKLAALTAWLRADMEDEERSLLTRDVLRDDIVTVDQADG